MSQDRHSRSVMEGISDAELWKNFSEQLTGVGEGNRGLIVIEVMSVPKSL